MAARKWTPEQRAKQSLLIRSWKPWSKSTGAKSPEGKKVSSRNAVNFSCREILRELARQNRALINYINGQTTTPIWDKVKIDGLLDDLEYSLYIQKYKTARSNIEYQLKNNHLGSDIEEHNKFFENTQ